MKKDFIMIVLLCVMAGVWSCAAIVGEPLPDDELMASSPDADFHLDVYMEGQPNENLFNTEGGYYIWRNGNDFSVRVARQGVGRIYPPAPMFSGAITVSRGIIGTVRRYNIAAPDALRYLTSNIDFRIEVKGDVSGFDFEVNPLGIEYCVNFDLRYNGMAAAQMVHLGPTMYVPDTMPLNICIR